MAFLDKNINNYLSLWYNIDGDKMSNKTIEKTMVMKILDKQKITYIPHHYESDSLDAVTCSKMLGKEPHQVYKTLVTVGSDNNHYCFMIPSNKELDLKKCAKVVGIKKIEMIPQRELEPLTGYVHGGCSPIGMKKRFLTFIEEEALKEETICYSAGRIGYQVETKPIDLINFMKIKTANLIKDCEE